MALAVLAGLLGALAVFGPGPAHAADFAVTNTNDTGGGSLRQAIEDANTAVGPDTISFAIPGSGVKTIALESDFLPAITDPVTIDGYTQTGASANTNPLSGGSDAVLLIELSGSLSGLKVNTNGSTIRGLVINRVGGSSSSGRAIEINGSDNVVEGNFLGTNAAGTAGTTHGFQYGALIGPEFLPSPGANNTIGGTTPAARNVVSGNSGAGIRVASGSGTVIQGNYIGTNAAGTAAVGSGFDEGIELGSQSFAGGTSAANTTIGGAAAGAGNLISGNGLSSGASAILIERRINGGSIQGNLIGTQLDGVSPLGNGSGIFIADGLNFTVGGLAPGQANTIAFSNGGHGVTVRGPSSTNGDGDNNNISGNSIHSNAGLGINLALGSEGTVTANDLGDADSGPNQEQNFPVLTSASVAGGNATVSGTLNSTANTTFRLEFFANAACDASGHGEGQTYIGTTNVTTDGSGNASFGPVSFPVPSGQSVFTATATAPDTDPSNTNNTNTSEFSQCRSAATNTPPTATNDSYNTDQDTALTVPDGPTDVLANDTDPNGDTLTAIKVSDPTNGSVTLNANGSFTYTPNNGFSGTDSFTYKANDGQADSNVATATITVQPGGTPPALTINDVKIKEGNGGTKNAVFTVQLDAPPGQQVTVDYATANGSAKTPKDYIATNGTLTFAPSDTQETISVPVKGDRRDERNENYFVNLSGANNATVGDGQGRGTIRDND